VVVEKEKISWEDLLKRRRSVEREKIWREGEDLTRGRRSVEREKICWEGEDLLRGRRSVEREKIHWEVRRSAEKICWFCWKEKICQNLPTKSHSASTSTTNSPFAVDSHLEKHN
jgi:hypothetical protein